MKNILFKLMTFCKTYKKRIIAVIGSSILAIIIILGTVGGVIYSHAKSNIKYSQDQLQKIALGKVPGEVVNVRKKLNFHNESFQYEFKIKDKDNMLQEVSLDSRYGAILRMNEENHKKDNRYGHGMQDGRHRNYQENGV